MQRRKFLLAGLASVPLASFAHWFTKEAHTEKPFVVKGGKSRYNESLTYRQVNSQDIKVSKNDTGNTISVLEYTGREKVGPPLHVHFYQDEVFYIAEGQYRFVVGKEEFIANEGDTIFLPRNIPHTWIQLSDKGRQLYILQPAGSFEEFLRNVQGLTHPPTEEELQKIHLEHGMKVLGPPLSL
jgi:quercetin dioxygenase-like cupin family protein